MRKRWGKEKRVKNKKLTGSNEGNGGWARTERDGGKQMRGKMKSEEKVKNKNKEGQKE